MPQEHEDTYRAAAQRLGAERGLTPEQFIQDAGQRLERYDYPTPDCLSPEDIVAFSTSATLLDEQRRHAETCRFCGPLLQSLSPSPERIADLRKVVAGPQEVPRTSWARAREAFAAIASGGWFPAAAMASIVCVLIAGWSIVNQHPTFMAIEVPTPSGVEVITRQVIANSDVLSIENSTSSKSIEALRKLLTSSTARAYSRVVKVDDESRRAQEFQTNLAKEMNHQKLAEKSATDKPPTQVRYRDVEAKFDADRLFNKLDKKRPDMLSAR